MLAVQLAFVTEADSRGQIKICHYMQKKTTTERLEKNHENVNGLDITLICRDNQNNKMF